jgi:ELWxxDGT repeat protein
VKDVRPGSSSSYPSRLTNGNGTLYYSADGGTAGAGLWKSDGTSLGTQSVWSGNIKPSFGGRHQFATVNGNVFFSANDGTHGYELWKSDGTTSGTVMVHDLFPGPFSSDPIYLTNVNGALYFSAQDGLRGQELWKTDGTSEGTAFVIDFTGDPLGSEPRVFPDALSEGLLVAATTPSHGRELYVLQLPGRPKPLSRPVTSTMLAPASLNSGSRKCLGH